jgi:hypothetical protein
MSRKSIVFIIAAFVLLLVGVGYLFNIFYNKENSGDPIAAIPIDATVVMRFPNAERLTSFQQEIGGVAKMFGDSDWFTEFVKGHQEIGRLAAGDEALSSLFSGSNLYVSIHSLGKGGNRVGYYIQLPPDMHDRSIQSMEGYFTSKGAKMAKNEYQGKTIVHIVPGTGFPFDFYYTVSNRIAIISSSRLIVESSIRQLASGESLTKSEGFRTLWNTLGGESAVNIMVRGSKFSMLIQPMLSSFAQNTKVLNTLTDWIALDGFTRSDALVGNGFSLASDSTNRLFRVFLRQSPQPITIAEVLPASVGCFVSYSIDDFNDFTTDIASYLDKENRLYNHKLRLSTLTKDNNFDVERFFRVAKPSVITSLFYRNDALENGGCWVNLYTLGDAETAKVLAKENFTNYAAESKVSSILAEVKVGEEKAPIYKLSFTDLSESMFGNLLFSFDEMAAGFYGNYFFTVSDPAGARPFVEALASTEKIKDCAAYKSVSPYAATMGNIFFFFNPGEGKSLFNLIDKTPLQKELTGNTSILENIGGVGIQMRSLKGKLFTNVFVTTRAGQKETTESAEWTFKADTLLASRPFVFKNHKTKASELAFQDISNKVYLIGVDGSLLWKIQASDRVVGDIQCVDFFKNYKNQLFFSTKSTVNLLDRNGEAVEGFPIKLPSPATGPASLFDYDNTGDYRIFVPVADGRVLLYDKGGKEVKGWKFKNTGGLVTTPVIFIKQGAKDYICINDGIRYYFLDRRGRERIKLAQSITPGLHTQCYSADDNSGLIVANKEGSIYKISPEGAVEELFSGSFDKNYYFHYQDINKDSKSELIFADENQLLVYKAGGEKMFSVKVEGDINERPSILSGESKVEPIISLVTDGGKGYAINSDGTVHSGFPFDCIYTPTIVMPSKNSNIVGALRVTAMGELKYYRIAQ